MTDDNLTVPEPEAPPEPTTNGFKSPRSNKVTQRTQQRTKRKRKPYSKTLARMKLAERALKPVNGKLAVEIMDEEIARFDGLMKVLYPWDAAGQQIANKSVNAYYWAAEMRRDYLAMRAPYQTPRLSAVAVVNPNQGQQTRKITEVNVTILNERGDREYTDSPGDPNIIDAEIVPPEDEEAA